LVQMLHANVTTAVYKIHGIMDGRQHDQLVDAYYDTLDQLQDRIAKQGPYLMGDSIRFADLVLFISLIRLDLAYQWRFGLGRKNVREDYPILLTYMKRILALDGVGDTVLPRDIMALYFLTLKWVQSDKGRTLPQVPSSWKVQCSVDGCKFNP
jgi:glutathionyl-hydroquinone reductase